MPLRVQARVFCVRAYLRYFFEKGAYLRYFPRGLFEKWVGLISDIFSEMGLI